MVQAVPECLRIRHFSLARVFFFAVVSIETYSTLLLLVMHFLLMDCAILAIPGLGDGSEAREI